MSFYAKGSPGSVLHLSNGDATGAPDASTIFHSSMPHVLATEEYSAALTHGGDNYYTCAMPSQVSNYVSNSDIIIITKVTLRDASGVDRDVVLGGGCASIGFSLQAGIYFQMGSTQSTSTSTGNIRTGITFSNDTTMDCGYFPSSTLATRYKVARGTGALYDFQAYSGLSNYTEWPVNGIPRPAVPQPNYRYNGPRMQYSGTVVARSSDTGAVTTVPMEFPDVYVTFNLNGYLKPPIGRSGGNDSFYIRLANPTTLIAVGDPTGTTTNEEQTAYRTYTPPANNPPGTYAGMTAKSTKHTPREASQSQQQPVQAVNLLDNAASYGNFALTPVKVTWYITNLTFNPSAGTYSATNPFTGTNIKLSPKDFIVKDVNLMNVTWSFITSISGTTPVNADYMMMGTSIYRADGNQNSPLSLTPIPLSTTAGATVAYGGASAGWTVSKLGLFQFSPNKEWYVDTATTSIGNKNGAVWSPNAIPLKLFADNTATTTLGGTVFRLGDVVTELTRLNLGLNTAREGAVISTTEFLDHTVLSAGGFGGVNSINYNPISPTVPDAELLNEGLRVTGSVTNFRHHKFTNLPVNQCVPIYVWRTMGYNYDTYLYDQPQWFYTDGSGAANTMLPMSFTLYLRNNGDGTASVLVYGGRDGNTNRMGGFSFVLPRIRLSVQKLT